MGTTVFQVLSSRFSSKDVFRRPRQTRKREPIELFNEEDLRLSKGGAFRRLQLHLKHLRNSNVDAAVGKTLHWCASVAFGGASSGSQCTMMCVAFSHMLLRC